MTSVNFSVIQYAIPIMWVTKQVFVHPYSYEDLIKSVDIGEHVKVNVSISMPRNTIQITSDIVLSYKLRKGKTFLDMATENILVCMKPCLD